MSQVIKKTFIIILVCVFFTKTVVADAASFSDINQ